MRKFVATEKHMPGLRRAAEGGVINVVKGSRVGRAVGDELDPGGLQFFH